MECAAVSCLLLCSGDPKSSFGNSSQLNLCQHVTCLAILFSVTSFVKREALQCVVRHPGFLNVGNTNAFNIFFIVHFLIADSCGCWFTRKILLAIDHISSFRKHYPLLLLFQLFIYVHLIFFWYICYPSMFYFHFLVSILSVSLWLLYLC